MGVLPERILLATDGSEDAVRATEAASDLANRSGAELHVVHVWHDVRGFAHDFVKRELRAPGTGGARRAGREDKGRRGRGREGASPRGTHLQPGHRARQGDRRWAPGRRQPRAGHGAAHPDGQPVRGDRAPRPGPRPRAQGREDFWPPARIVIGEDFSDDARKAGELAAGHRQALRRERPDRLLPPRPARDPSRGGEVHGQEPRGHARARRGDARRHGPASWKSSWVASRRSGSPATTRPKSPRRLPGGAALTRGRRQQGPGGNSAHQARERLDQGRDRRARTRPRLSARRLGISEV